MQASKEQMQEAIDRSKALDQYVVKMGIGLIGYTPVDTQDQEELPSVKRAISDYLSN